MSSNPQKVQAIFLAAVEKPPAERAAHLDCECGDDAELRQRVEALLKAHDEPGSFLRSPPPGMDATLAQAITEMPIADLRRLVAAGPAATAEKLQLGNRTLAEPLHEAVAFGIRAMAQMP